MVHLSLIMPEPSAESLEPRAEVSQPVDKTAPNHPNIPEHQLHKSRLQEYTQRSGIPLPIYQTINEGAQHASRFRSTVLVDGSYYTSQLTFPNRKAAEQDVASVAFQRITQKVKDEGYEVIRKDIVFCKSILNEYAGKMNLEKPTYTTIQQEGLLPVFVSHLVFNGNTCTGEIGRNKREAEQLAARAVVLSILGNSDSGTAMSEIIKSKYKLYAALHKFTGVSNTHVGFAPTAVNTGTSLGFPPSKGKEVQVTGCTNYMPSNNSPATQRPFHEFKKPKIGPSSETFTPPIVFVPPVLEQPLGVVGSSSAKKKNHKKKAKKQTPA